MLLNPARLTRSHRAEARNRGRRPRGRYADRPNPLGAAALAVPNTNPFNTFRCFCPHTSFALCCELRAVRRDMLVGLLLVRLHVVFGRTIKMLRIERFVPSALAL